MNKNFIQKRTFINTFALIILFCLPFLLCAKANAITFNMNLGEPYLAGSFSNGYCVYYNAGLKQSTIQNQSCQIYDPNSASIAQAVDVYSFYTQPNIKTDKDKIYEITFRIVNRYDYKPIMINPQSPSQWKMLDIKEDFSATASQYCDVYLNSITSSDPNATGSQICQNKSNAFAVTQYKAYFVYVGNNEYDSIGIYANITDSSFIAFNIINPVVEPKIYFDDIYAYSVIVPDLQRAEQETQQATDEGQQNADSAEAQNEQASTNIVGIVGKVVGAFNTPPSSCSIPIVASGVDLGNVDFCTGKPPFWAQLVGGVGSLILVYACYRVALNMFNLFISLTVFAQGGKSRGGNG